MVKLCTLRQYDSQSTDVQLGGDHISVPQCVFEIRYTRKSGLLSSRRNNSQNGPMESNGNLTGTGFGQTGRTEQQIALHLSSESLYISNVIIWMKRLLA